MDFDKSRSQREQEEKLLISAWYNMVSAPLPVGSTGSVGGCWCPGGPSDPSSAPPSLQGIALQQRAGEERAPAHAQSFLAQQRLATNARRGPLGRLATLNMRPADKH